jgi:hypothetical protein
MHPANRIYQRPCEPDAKFCSDKCRMTAARHAANIRMGCRPISRTPYASGGRARLGEEKRAVTKLYPYDCARTRSIAPEMQVDVSSRLPTRILRRDHSNSTARLRSSETVLGSRCPQMA